jgi:hypothetical protein
MPVTSPSRLSGSNTGWWAPRFDSRGGVLMSGIIRWMRHVTRVEELREHATISVSQPGKSVHLVDVEVDEVSCFGLEQIASRFRDSLRPACLQLFRSRPDV